MKVYLKSKNLKEILIRKNKSQNWLAYRLEVSSGYMSQLMDGSRSPSPKLRERMMNILIEYKFDHLFIIKGEEEIGHLECHETSNRSIAKKL